MSAGDGITLVLSGRAVMIVGVEDDPHGCVRMYIGHRMYGRYVLLVGQEAENAKRVWADPSTKPVVDGDALRGRYVHEDGIRSHERAILHHLDALEAIAELEEQAAKVAA
jgi:hypothetical protein